eukprot:IDg11475t1
MQGASNRCRSCNIALTLNLRLHMGTRDRMVDGRPAPPLTLQVAAIRRGSAGLPPPQSVRPALIWQPGVIWRPAGGRTVGAERGTLSSMIRSSNKDYSGTLLCSARRSNYSTVTAVAECTPTGAALVSALRGRLIHRSRTDSRTTERTTFEFQGVSAGARRPPCATRAACGRQLLRRPSNTRARLMRSPPIISARTAARRHAVHDPTRERPPIYPRTAGARPMP